MKTYVDHTPRLALVGYGRWGRECHAYHISTTPGLELRAIVSSSPDKRAAAEQKHHCLTYETVDQAINDPLIDAIVLATPNATHADLAIRAMNAGKHVLTDKAMCLNLAECDRMIDAAHRNDRILTVFQNRRFDGDFLTLKSLMENGSLGDLKWLELAWTGFGIWGGWRAQKANGGGKLYDLGAHLIDQTLQLFPEPVESVYCKAHFDFPEVDVESHSMIVINFAGGRTAVITTSSMAAIGKPHFYALGTKASFSKFGLDPQERAQSLGNIDAAVEDPSTYGLLKSRDKEETIPTIPGRWRNLYENFRDVLLGKAEPLVSLESERRLMQVFDALFQSITTHQAVTP